MSDMDTAASSARQDDRAGQMKAAVSEKIGSAAQAVKEKAGDAGQSAKDRTGEFAAKAHDVVTSEEVQPVARRSGAGVALLAAAGFAIWAWRRRSLRNASTWEKAVRGTKSQAKVARGQAKAQARAAKAIANEKVARARAKARR